MLKIKYRISIGSQPNHQLEIGNLQKSWDFWLNKQPKHSKSLNSEMENDKFKTQHQLNTNDANMKRIRENSINCSKLHRKTSWSTSKNKSQTQMNNTDI